MTASPIQSRRVARAVAGVVMAFKTLQCRHPKDDEGGGDPTIDSLPQEGASQQDDQQPFVIEAPPPPLRYYDSIRAQEAE